MEQYCSKRGHRQYLKRGGDMFQPDHFTIIMVTEVFAF